MTQYDDDTIAIINPVVVVVKAIVVFHDMTKNVTKASIYLQYD